MSNAATPATPEALLDQVTKLTETVVAQGEQLKEINERASKAAEELRKSPFGAPFARKGESALTSRGYSYLKAFGVIANQVDQENAKVECMMAQKLKDYHSGYSGYNQAQKKSLMVPMGAEFVVNNPDLSEEVRATVKAGVTGWDPEEIKSVRQKAAVLGLTKALSWIDETVGATLVAPPVMGELIELLRNNEVLMAAGAKVLPMPPQGRIIYPRQTSAMTANHVGESQSLTESTPGTGDLVLSAKKLTILAKIPNELFHFSAIPIEGFVRNDMAKVMALKMDKTLLEDAGSTTTPKGLINYANITTHTSTGTPADGNSGFPLQPKDVYQLIAKVEEQNAEFKAFIMRPLLWASIVNARADAVSANDQKGPFLFNVWRDRGDSVDIKTPSVGYLGGYPVYKSTQLSTTHTRGSGTTNNTYIIAGDFEDYLIAMSAAIEFAVSTQGDTPFTSDQTWLRGVTYYDGGPRHEASFVYCDQLLQSF